jgi:hypothetical protein
VRLRRYQIRLCGARLIFSSPNQSLLPLELRFSLVRLLLRCDPLLR